MDPLAEKYPGISPYSYCAGNPINFVDPDGRKVRIRVGNTSVGTTSIYLYSSSERKEHKISGEYKITVPVYQVDIQNDSGSSNTYYYTRIGYRKDIENQGKPAYEVTFDVKFSGDTFNAVVKDRWNKKNNVLELRSLSDVEDQGLDAMRGQDSAKRYGIQFHVKGATDGCLMSVGTRDFLSIDSSTQIRSDLPNTSSAAQESFMDDVVNYRAEDVKNKYDDGIFVSFEKIY